MSDIQLIIVGVIFVFGVAISGILLFWNFKTLADEIF